MLNGVLILLAGFGVQPQAQGSAAIVIDATVQTPISPFIYGANFPDWKALDLPFPFVRQGGNRMTAYNWENNASNAGNDYRNQNDAYLGATNEPGWVGSSFLKEGQSHKAAVLLTIPMAGYVSADKAPDDDVNKTPDYLNNRFLVSKAKKPTSFTYPPDLTDRVVYQDEYVHYLESIKSKFTAVWYALDNEPDIWASTHSRIVDHNPTYREFIDRSLSWASAIKVVAPQSLIFGPASYGWQGFRRFQNAADANNRDFLDVYLTEMKQAESAQHKRLLDVLDIHWYPEARGGGVRITDGPDKPGMAEARIQCPRSLWDPTYVEDSWITQNIGKKAIDLIPGFQAQIKAHYPGTKLAFTEYNYGGGQSISGAIAEADVLGIFGRYGVFAASHWVPTVKDPFIVAGFRAFLNFDGKGSRFGDMGLAVTGPDPEKESVYAALDAKNPKRMTLLIINKTAAIRAVSLAFKGLAIKTASSNVIEGESPVSRHTDLAGASGSSLIYNAPALSVSTIEVTAR